MIAALLHAGFFAANLESVAATASLCILAGMVCMVVFNTLTAPRAGGQKSPTVFPKVSLLVPARNEAHNVPILAAHFEKLEYPNLEIILLDDASDDGTGAALGDLVNLPALRGRARSLRGAELPTGWLGKNWACHQLAQTSSGDVLIFCDADARPGPQAVTRTVALLEHYGVGCATLMPRQVLGSWAERAVIPVLLHISLFCFLPIALVPRLRWKRLGVGNGQWLSFRRSAYAAVGGHAGVRDKVVEDIALAQRAQTHGNGLVVGLATDTGGGSSFSMLRTMAAAYEVAQLRGQALHPAQLWWLATQGSARALRAEHQIGNIAVGQEADLVVVNLASTPAIEQATRRAEDIWQALFPTIMLGDDRAIQAVWALGRLVL